MSSTERKDLDDVVEDFVEDWIFGLASPALGRGGSFGEALAAELLVLSVALLVVGVVSVSPETLEAWLSFDVALDEGFLPALVGVLGPELLPVFPAAGEGAILDREVLAVCGDGVLLLLLLLVALCGGEERLGVGGKE